MARGGARPGSGRKKTGVATQKWKGPPLPESGSLTPLEFWKAVLRDPLAPYEIRAQAAKEAGPYMHAFPFSRTVNGSEQLLKFDGLYVDPAGFVRGRNVAGYPPKTVSGNYTIAQEDDGNILVSADDSDITYTVPVLLPGSRITVIQGGGGKVTFKAVESLTLCSGTGAAGFTVQQWSPCEFIWLGNGKVLMTGALA